MPKSTFTCKICNTNYTDCKGFSKCKECGHFICHDCYELNHDMAPVCLDCINNLLKRRIDGLSIKN